MVRNAPPAEMKRVIGLLDITMISVGAILASGIFLVPATIALHIQSPSLTLMLWMGGVLSLCSAPFLSLNWAQRCPAQADSTFT